MKHYLQALELPYIGKPEYKIEKNMLFKRIRTAEECLCCGRPQIVYAWLYVRDISEKEMLENRKRVQALLKEAFNK